MSNIKTAETLIEEARNRRKGMAIDGEVRPEASHNFIVDDQTGVTYGWPDNLDKIHDASLQRWLGHLGAWKAYLTGILAELDAALPFAKTQLDVAATQAQLVYDERHATLLLAATGSAQKMRDAEVTKEIGSKLRPKVDPDVILARHALLDLEASRKIAQVKLDALEHRYAALSRAVKLRGDARWDRTTDAGQGNQRPQRSSQANQGRERW